jgi:hypothetical protein
MLLKVQLIKMILIIAGWIKLRDVRTMHAIQIYRMLKNRVASP